jgi:hypothetical protein
MWSARGYRVACLTDGVDKPDIDCDLHVHVAEFKSWGAAQNLLANEILHAAPHGSIIIAGSDDVEPDPHRGPEYGHRQMVAVFGESLYGVMQPTGD